MQKGHVFYDLAPEHLPNFRVRRYQGDDLCLPVAAFTSDDRLRVVALYDWLEQLMAVLSAGRELAGLQEFLGRNSADATMTLVQEFGRSSLAQNPSPLLAKTLHDVRGGALAGILAQLELGELTGKWEAALHALYFLTRDHLKIMRNALLGLDDRKRAEDLKTKIHGTDFIMEKWHGATLRGQGRNLRLEVECPQPVAISECCVEFGALDRILYNLINNATRHAFADHIRLVLLPVPDLEGMNLRFVLINTVSPKDLSHLRGINLASLFEEGASTTGSGYGLAIATEFVCHAYGLTEGHEAIKGGYLGATLIDDSFAAWFHWPRVLED